MNNRPDQQNTSQERNEEERSPMVKMIEQLLVRQQAEREGILQTLAHMQIDIDGLNRVLAFLDQDNESLQMAAVPAVIGDKLFDIFQQYQMGRLAQSQPLDGVIDSRQEAFGVDGKRSSGLYTGEVSFLLTGNIRLHCHYAVSLPTPEPESYWLTRDNGFNRS